MPTQETRTKAWARRVERRNRATGTQIGRSEELAAAVYPAWLRRLGRTPDLQHERPVIDVDGLGRREVDECLADLDRLSGAWGALDVGGSVDVDWPWPERR